MQRSVIVSWEALPTQLRPKPSHLSTRIIEIEQIMDAKQNMHYVSSDVNPFDLLLTGNMVTLQRLLASDPSFGGLFQPIKPY